MPAIEKRSERLLEELVEALVDEQQNSEEVDLDRMRFAVMERLGHEMGKRLSTRVQAALVRRQHERAEPPAECPECGGRLRRAIKLREVKGLDGPVPVEEHAGYCRRCRRTFFPSA